MFLSLLLDECGATFWDITTGCKALHSRLVLRTGEGLVECSMTVLIQI